MKYYKILRFDMKHHGFVYKEGLNIDTEPFDETPDCRGGLFFSDAEHILSFVDYGDLIAEVEIPIGEKLVKVEDKYKAHAIVLKNIKSIWTVDTFKYFIEEDIDIHVQNDYAFQYACETGNLELVKFWVDNNADIIHADDDLALQLAARNGYLEVVRYLINNGADIHADNDWALQLAAKNGYLEVVRYLINNGADIHADDDLALQLAVEKGYLEVVKCLIDNGANIHADDDDALRWAAEYGYLDIVKYLAGHGANIHANDDWAFKYGTPKVVAYLNSLNK